MTPGGQIVYTLTVTNVSGCNADQVVVNDTIPGGTHFITSADASCTQNTATNVACTLGTMHGGQSRTFTLTFQTVNGIACNSAVINQAVVSTVTQESNTGNNASQTVSTTVQCDASSSSSSSSSSVIGEGCIEVIKTARDTNGSTLSVVPQFTFTLDGNRTAVNNSNGRARFDNVSVGTHTVIESVPQGWVLENVNPSNGTVNVNQGSSCAQVYFSNRQNTVTTTDFSISKTDGESEVEPGDDLEYTITVRNNSNQTVNNVTVTDTLPDEVAFDSCSDNCSRNGRTITWNNLTFAANEEKELRLEVEVDDDADGRITNHAYVFNLTATDHTDVEEVEADNDDDDVAADVTKDASTAEVFPGGIVEYTVQIRNTGDGDINNVTVTDTLPNGVTLIDVAGGQQSGNVITWTVDRLNENETWTKRYRVTVDPSTLPGTILRNNVRVHGGGIDESETTTVSVIGNLPQTGFHGGQTALKLKAIHRGQGTANVPLVVWISIITAGTGAGLGFGRRFLFGI